MKYRRSSGLSRELKVAGPSMLGIGCPDRHALPHITPPKTRRPRYALPPTRARSFSGALALAAHSGEGPLPIRFADLGHRALKTGGLLNSRPIFRADRTGSWLRMRHLAAHFSGWFVLA